MPYVIDNSIVCGWFIQNQASAYGEAVASACLERTRQPDFGVAGGGTWPHNTPPVAQSLFLMS